jgi:hypothetical protein
VGDDNSDDDSIGVWPPWSNTNSDDVREILIFLLVIIV